MTKFKLYGKTLIKVDNQGKERIVTRFKDLKIAKAYCKSTNLVVNHPRTSKPQPKGIMDFVAEHAKREGII